MKKYEVEISKTALDDMEKIYNYIADELLSPENAMAQYNRIAEVVLKLEEFPNRNPIYNSKLARQIELHFCPIDAYLIFYVIDERTVTVTDVFYSASDVERHLKDRHHKG